MTTEEIVEAARAAGFSTSEMMTRLPAFKRLIESVVASEREACAKLCDDEAEQFAQCAGSMTTGAYDWKADGATDCAEAIRARSNK